MLRTHSQIMKRYKGHLFMLCIAVCTIIYVIVHLEGLTPRHENKLKTTCKEISDFAMFLRMHAPKRNLYEHIFVQSMKYFWLFDNPLIVVLDKNEEDKAYGKEIQNKYPYPKIYHEEPFESHLYHGVGSKLQQLSMFHADKYTNKTYVGFVDTDTMFVTIVTPDQLFIDGKPVIIGQYGISTNGFWHEAPKMTELALGKKEVFKCMFYFPVMVMVKHLAEMRDYMAKLHKMEFDKVFEKFSSKPFSQFSIMCNYLWYFHRNEYTFHAELRGSNGKWNGERNSPGRQGPAYYKENVPEAMRYPVARTSVHYKYLNGWTKPKTFQKIMKLGLCHSGGFKFCPEICNSIDKDKVVEDLFVFEFNDWRWDKRCIDAQRNHTENIKLMNEIEVKKRILLGCQDIDKLTFKVP